MCKVFALLSLLYFFICSLDLLGSAFRLLGGRAAGATFSDNKVLQNPIAGLMIGVLATVLVQSSSTSTSIVVTMVASGIMTVKPAIPVIMGANIGTSLTNTIVSMAQSADRTEFRRAFAGATVHDMFNWLTVIILLPLEMATGYLFHLTNAIVSTFTVDSNLASSAKHDMLQIITKPFTELIIQLDKTVIEGIATGDPSYADKSLLKEWCAYTTEAGHVNITSLVNMTTSSDNITGSLLMNVTEEQEVNLSVPIKGCTYLFHSRGLGDYAVGGILLVISLLLLCGSLVLMVKILNSALRGKVLTAVKKTVNAELPGYAAYFTGYLFMVIGAIMTMLVQSSSVFTSVLTPLVGVGVVKIERMYPLTLGSNIGTTTTGLLAAMAASSDQLKPALQIAFCHLFFNLSGILLFYPIPKLRIPIQLAKMMGKTTSKYRWFAAVYVIMMFFAIPMSVFALSWAGNVVLTSVVSVCAFIIATIIVINLLQRRRRHWLPIKLRDWNFLPMCFHSLKPADRVIQKAMKLVCRLWCCGCCKKSDVESSPSSDEVDGLKKTSSESGDSGDVVEGLIKNLSTTNFDETNSMRVSQEYALKRIISEDVESGYGSTTATPAPSRLPSYVQLTVLNMNGEFDTPAPSRLPSYAKLPIHTIDEVVTSDDENNDNPKM